MADPILVFPRVIIKPVDPAPADNITQGFIEGNVWINTVTGKIYTCINRESGLWVEMVSIGASSVGDISFDIAPSNFLVNAGNIRLDAVGDLRLTGENLTINVDALDPPTDMCYFNIYRGGSSEQNASVSWNENANRWESGVRPNLWPVVTAVMQTRDPLPTDYENHFVGQTWINLVTQQKFTCVSRLGGVSTWRLALTSAPTKAIIEGDDHIILYGEDDRSFTKIHWLDMVEWVRYALGFGLEPVTPEYGFQTDEVSNIMPSDEDPVTNGLFEADLLGDLIPTNTPFDDPNDDFYELDGDDIMLREAVPVVVGGGGAGGTTIITESMTALIITADQSILSGEKYLIDGGLTVTLPPTPSTGDMIALIPGGDWSVNPLTVARNGRNIMGVDEDLICDTRVEIILVFKDLTQGWIVVD